MNERPIDTGYGSRMADDISVSNEAKTGAPLFSPTGVVEKEETFMKKLEKYIGLIQNVGSELAGVMREIASSAKAMRERVGNSDVRVGDYQSPRGSRFITGQKSDPGNAKIKLGASIRAVLHKALRLFFSPEVQKFLGLGKRNKDIAPKGSLEDYLPSPSAEIKPIAKSDEIKPGSSVNFTTC